MDKGRQCVSYLATARECLDARLIEDQHSSDVYFGPRVAGVDVGQSLADRVLNGDGRRISCARRTNADA